MSDDKSGITDADKVAALTRPMGTGGIIGGGGYSAQERYIVCHAPEWIFREGFTYIWPEGTGDVDVFFENLSEPYAEHIQVKNYDHNVTPGDLRAVVEGFVKWEKDREILYRKFTLAAPSLNADVNALRNILERVRNAPQLALTQVETQDLDAAIAKVELCQHADFIKRKLYFHTGLHDLADDKTCFRHFQGAILEQEEYKQRALPGGRNAFDKFLIAIKNSQGKTVPLEHIKALLELAFGLAVEEEGTNLVIHNWEVQSEDFGGHPVHEFDWTEFFDRDVSPRIVPSATQWNNTLVPQIRTLKKQLRQEKAISFIRFRGRCALSTGFAVGATFPQTGGWAIETPQPNVENLWCTNSATSSNYQLVTRFLGKEDGFIPDSNSPNLLVIVCVTQINTDNVNDYFNSTANSPTFKAVVQIEPTGGARYGSIIDANDAANFAIALRDYLKKQNLQQRTRAVHLFYNGPQALSVMLGYWLTSINTVHLYEFLQPSEPDQPLFAPSCVIST